MTLFPHIVGIKPIVIGVYFHPLWPFPMVAQWLLDGWSTFVFCARSLVSVACGGRLAELSGGFSHGSSEIN